MRCPVLKGESLGPAIHGWLMRSRGHPHLQSSALLARRGLGLPRIYLPVKPDTQLCLPTLLCSSLLRPLLVLRSGSLTLGRMPPTYRSLRPQLTQVNCLPCWGANHVRIQTACRAALCGWRGPFPLLIYSLCSVSSVPLLRVKGPAMG